MTVGHRSMLKCILTVEGLLNCCMRMVLGQFVEYNLIDMHGTSDTVKQTCVFS
jgi:hypothetical protein